MSCSSRDLPLYNIVLVPQVIGGCSSGRKCLLYAALYSSSVWKYDTNISKLCKCNLFSHVSPCVLNNVAKQMTSNSCKDNFQHTQRNVSHGKLHQYSLSSVFMSVIHKDSWITVLYDPSSSVLSLSQPLSGFRLHHSSPPLSLPVNLAPIYSPLLLSPAASRRLLIYALDLAAF